MQSTFGKAKERTPLRPAPNSTLPAAITPTVKEIPYDYVATFALEGKRGNRVQQLINISTDGAFVAVTIGYSFIPAPLPPLSESEFSATQARLRALGLLALGAGGRVQSVNDVMEDPRTLLQCLVRFCGIDFKYNIIDSGSGRELQNLAIHNVAGLGESNGGRPFRPMAKPMLFMPRSTIRIEVEEVSEGRIYGYDELNSAGQKTGRRIGSELYFVLHGYKMLGYGTG